LPYDEHLNAATPEQVTAWMAAGKLTHLGYGKSKVRGTR
jgi:hypothetical protein